VIQLPSANFREHQKFTRPTKSVIWQEIGSLAPTLPSPTRLAYGLPSSSAYSLESPGSALEWLGYMFRIFAIAAEGPGMLSFLVTSQTFLIVTPALLVAQGYIVVERMMTFVGKEYGFTDHNEITRIFLGADVVAILMQAIGSSVLTEARGDLYQAKVAKKILVAGLLLQIIPLGIYFCLAVAFDLRSSRDPALRGYGTQMKGLRKLWIVFYISAVLITLRSIYRAVEFAEIAPGPRGVYDPDKYLFTHEWPLYVFDAVPILTERTMSRKDGAFSAGAVFASQAREGL
ncbi:hypothetical protein FRC01_006408, partial [Tulasnella sp. 417]